MSEEKSGKGRANDSKDVPLTFVEQRLFDRMVAARERRRREEQWLELLLERKIIRFSDVQLAAELLARHRWEDATRAEEPGAPASLAALQYLCELRARREGWTGNTKPKSLPPPDGSKS